MEYSDIQKELLKKLPKVDRLAASLPEDLPRSVRTRAAQLTVEALRQRIFSTPQPTEDLVSTETVEAELNARIRRLMTPSLRPLVNATGVVVHTNLGRSPLPDFVLDAMVQVARGYCNLEYNLEEGKRGSRYSHVEELLCELTGAEAALVVNNNAAGVLITLETLARGREVIVSRGELVEIGGSFRIPDVMARSGAILREVGATNRTHLKDYMAAIGADTALLMKVHQSNFQIVGFTKSVSVRDLAELGTKYGIPVFEDLGSGNFIDFSKYGMLHEPTVQEALAAGADIVSFSGDKLLGGPQAGIILGRRKFIDKIKMNPMNRAVRIDKLTLAALEQVLRLYREPEEAVKRLPTLRMLTTSYMELKERAEALEKYLQGLNLPGVTIDTVETVSRVGGGALPLQDLTSRAIRIRAAGPAFSLSRVEEALRRHEPPIIVRMESEAILMDVRTIQAGEERIIGDALARVISQVSGS